MVKLPKIIRDFTSFQDGVGLAGRCEEATIPDIDFVTEEHTAGGMGGTVDLWMGLMAKMESEITLTGMSSDFTRQLGKPDGTMTHRGDLSDGKVSEAAIFEMRGLFKKGTFGSMKRKDKGQTKVMASLTYFKATIGGREVVEIDVINKVCRIDGEDRFAESRANLGA